MFERIKVEAGLEKNVRRFITRLKEDAKAWQAFGPQVTTPDLKREDTPPTADTTGKGRSGSYSGGAVRVVATPVEKRMEARRAKNQSVIIRRIV